MRIVAGQEPYVLPSEDETGSGRQRPRQPEQSAVDSYGRRPVDPSGAGRARVDPADPLGIRRPPDTKRVGTSRPFPDHGAPSDAESYAQDGYPSNGYPPDGYPPEGYPADRYDPNGYSSDGYAPAAENYPRDGYTPDGYGRDAYPPGGYSPGGYDASGYQAAPYRDPRDDPRDDPRRNPRDEPRRGEPWGYDRNRADPYAPSHPAPGGGDDPFGLDRASAVPRGPVTAPPDYHRPRPNQHVPARPPSREAGDGYDAACPSCHNPHEPGTRFCEVCGFDLVLRERPGTPDRGAVQTGWDVLVEAEREYYDSGDDHRVPFPTVYPRRVFTLSGPRLLIGRRSESRGIHPEIDLSGTPEDPGISRAHAMLQLMADGGYAVLDPGSTNGTRINDEPNPIPPGQPVPLRNGDRVYLGAWTRITIRMLAR